MFGACLDSSALTRFHCPFVADRGAVAPHLFSRTVHTSSAIDPKAFPCRFLPEMPERTETDKIVEVLLLLFLPVSPVQTPLNVPCSLWPFGITTGNAAPRFVLLPELSSEKKTTSDSGVCDVFTAISGNDVVALRFHSMAELLTAPVCFPSRASAESPRIRRGTHRIPVCRSA